MKIEMRRIDDIRPYGKNPRMNDQAVEAVAKSIQAFGWRNPVVVDKDGVIIAGHTRIKAAQKLGITEIPVHVAENLTPEQVKAYRIADNRIGELAEWDKDLLKLEIGDLQLANFDVRLLGFGDNEIKAIMHRGMGNKTDENAIPEISGEVKSKLGELYILGGHRLLCGDATDQATVTRLMHGEKALLMNTDPPYGVNLDQSWRDAALPDHEGLGNKNKVMNDERADWTDAWKLADVQVAYIWHAGRHSDVVLASMRNAGYELVQQIIWNKTRMVMGRCNYHFKHEPCFYCVKKGLTHRWVGDRTQTTVWDAIAPNQVGSGSTEASTDHPTQKPVLLFEIPIKNHLVPNDICYEPFAGSGTQFIAAEKMSVRCYGLELSPKYADIIRKRWAEFMYGPGCDWGKVTPKEQGA